MHPEIEDWVAGHVVRWCSAGNTPSHVLEVGSYDMNGTLRRSPFFPGTRYFGVDIAPGVGVDALAYGWHLPAKREAFDIVLCLQVLEHTNRKGAILDEIQRALRDGGLCIVTCAGPGYPRHDGRTGYYRPMSGPALLRELSQMYRSCGVVCEPNSLGYPDVKAWAIK